MTAGPRGPLGIIAGRGDLPRTLAEARAAADAPYLVVALDGFAGEWIESHPHVRHPITAPSRILASLRSIGATDVVAAGGVDRPSLRALTDPLAVRWLPRLAPAMMKGDDALLRTVKILLEDEGLRLIGAEEVIGLTAMEGLLVGPAPSPIDTGDAERGEAILAALGPLDVGQACVVASGRVLGIETIQGTDALLDFVGRTRTAGQGAEGGVLTKRAKVGQDRTLDLPTIGPATVEGVARAGLHGIAIERGAVHVLDGTLDAAAAEGLFVWARR